MKRLWKNHQLPESHQKNPVLAKEYYKLSAIENNADEACLKIFSDTRMDF